MATPTLTHAETARLAHQALRLREQGYDSEQAVRKLAQQAPAPAPAGDQHVNRGGAHPLSSVALHVVRTMDPDQPGPTDPKAVQRLMALPTLDDLWRTWNDASTANVEALLDDKALAAWRKANQDAQEAYEQREAMMRGASDGELLQRVEDALASQGFTDEEADRVRAQLATQDRDKEWRVHPYFGHMRHLDGAANALYDLGREGFADGTIQWPTPTIKVALVDSAVYTVNLATHQFMSSVASTVAVSPAFTTKTKAAGVLDADDAVFSTVTGAQSEALIVFQSSAVGGGADVAAASQRLIGYYDTGTGLPVTPNGGNITVAWDNGSNRIVKL